MRMLGVGQITRTIILNSIPWANFSQAASPLQRSSPSCVLPCWSSQPALTSLASPCLICSSQKVAGRTARRRGWPQGSSSQTCKSRDGCSRRARQLPGSLREPCSSEFQQTIQEYWSNSTSLKVQSLSPWFCWLGQSSPKECSPILSPYGRRSCYEERQLHGQFGKTESLRGALAGCQSHCLARFAQRGRLQQRTPWQWRRSPQFQRPQ